MELKTKMINNMKEFKMCSIRSLSNGIPLPKLNKKVISRIISSSNKLVEGHMDLYAK